jgi:NitT/TauT family transport system substrate-binding protein
MKKVKATISLALCMLALPALAQEKIKFQPDWRFEGPSAFFLVAKSKGYFAEESWM